MKERNSSGKIGAIMQTSGPRRMFIIAGVVSLFVSYLGIWIRLINNPIERTGSDFIAFYSAGRVAQEKGIANVYDPLLQQDIQEQEVGFPLVPGQVLLYNHLPYLIPVLQGIANTNYVGSFCRWLVILILLYVIGIIFMNRILKDSGFDRNTVVLSALSSLLFLPLFFSLMNGQDTAFLFLGAALWMYGLVSGREMLGGLGLSLTTVRPHIALMLSLPMLFRHRKLFFGFVLGAGMLALVSILILGERGTREFINIIFLSAGGEWYGMKENAMYNLIGLLTRTLPWLRNETIRLIGWVVYGVTIIGLCILWTKSRDLQNGLLGMTVIFALFAVPHLHFHDLTLLLIPIYELIRSSRQVGRLKTETATILPIAISLLLLLGNASSILQYTIPYLIMIALVLYLYFFKREAVTIAPHQS